MSLQTNTYHNYILIYANSTKLKKRSEVKHATILFRGCNSHSPIGVQRVYPLPHTSFADPVTANLLEPTMSFIKLDPHPLTDLPDHPYLQGQETNQVSSLIQTVLHEANPHLNKLQASLQADPKLRPSPPSTTKIKLSQGWHEGEFWVCRQSDHEDTPTDGTASWHEFQNGLRHNHAEHEMQYTPSVTKVVQLLNWEQNGSWDPRLRLEVDGTAYKDFVVERESSSNLKYNAIIVVDGVKLILIHS